MHSLWLSVGDRVLHRQLRAKFVVIGLLGDGTAECVPAQFGSYGNYKSQRFSTADLDKITD